MTRSSEMLSSIPLASLAIIILCTGVYVCQLVFDPYLHHYTLCPRPIIHLNEYYRFITSTLFHGSIMHIGMNMLSTAAISSMLEKRFGTIRHAITVMWSMLLVSFVHTMMAVLAHLLIGMDKLMYQHSVGFSGVIFHMSVLEANLTPNRARSVFGFVTVPSFLYPWALLVALQVFMPNLSFMGHLSGILTGTLQLYGCLDFLLVGEDYLHHMESWSALRTITARSTFVKTPNAIETGSQLQRDPASLQRSIRTGIGMLCKFIKDVIETIKFCIFGSGQEANANIHVLGGTSSSWGGSSPTRSVPEAIDTEDDDWVGLPPMPASQPDPETRLV